MVKHVVKQGEDINLIAYSYGFFPDTVWLDAENTELREARGNPDTLFPGDVVSIPDKKAREAKCSTGSKHRFRLKGVPAVVEIRFSYDGEPYARQPYRIVASGYRGKAEGELDDEGRIKIRVMPDIGKIRIIIGDPETVEYELSVGCIDPIDTVSGAQARLRNLGFACDDDGIIGERTVEAIEAFQARSLALEKTGELDEATKEELKKRHGS